MVGGKRYIIFRVFVFWEFSFSFGLYALSSEIHLPSVVDERKLCFFSNCRCQTPPMLYMINHTLALKLKNEGERDQYIS